MIKQLRLAFSQNGAGGQMTMRVMTPDEKI